MVSKLGSIFKTKMPRLVLTCALTCGSLALPGASVPSTTVNWQTLQTLNS